MVIWNRRLLELALLKECELSKSLYIKRVFFPSEAIHQRILLYNNLVIAQAITKLLHSKVLNSHKENNIMCVSSLY